LLLELFWWISKRNFYCVANILYFCLFLQKSSSDKLWLHRI
jgi:hypothetical protein